jgi:hypothetical protein
MVEAGGGDLAFRLILATTFSSSLSLSINPFAPTNEPFVASGSSFERFLLFAAY